MATARDERGGGMSARPTAGSPGRGRRIVGRVTGAPGRLGTPLAWTATVLFVLLMVLWTIVTPGFRNPDEPQHVNSVLRVAEGGGWPRPSEAYMAPEVLRAKVLTGFSAVDGQEGPWAGGTLLPGLRAGVTDENLMYYALFSLQNPTPVDDRLPFDQLELDQGVDLSHHGDQMTQHPPLYYAVNAGVVRAAGALDWRFDRTLALMRLVSVALVAPLPLLVGALQLGQGAPRGVQPPAGDEQPPRGVAHRLLAHGHAEALLAVRPPVGDDQDVLPAQAGQAPAAALPDVGRAGAGADGGAQAAGEVAQVAQLVVAPGLREPVPLELAQLVRRPVPAPVEGHAVQHGGGGRARPQGLPGVGAPGEPRAGGLGVRRLRRRGPVQRGHQSRLLSGGGSPVRGGYKVGGRCRRRGVREGRAAA